MPNVFVISDTHFGHGKIIEHCIRPFEDEDQMNKAMVDNWNSLVGPKDTVIHLGDVGWRNVHYWVTQLNGRKILVEGNHDNRMNAATRRLFAHVFPIWDTKVEGQRVTFCHYPMQAWNKSHRGSLHLHGHSHGGAEESMTHLRWDMSVDVWDFKPVPWDIIMDKYHHKKLQWDKAIAEMPIGKDISNRKAIIEFNKQFLNSERGEHV